MSKQTEITDPMATYRVIDMTLEEVKRLGAWRYQQQQQKRGLDWLVVPAVLIWFLFGLFLKIPAIWVMLGIVAPFGYGYWSVWRKYGKQKKAAQQFVNSPSVRKNGGPEESQSPAKLVGLDRNPLS